MAEFVFENDFNQLKTIGHKPTALAGNERGVFHAASRGVRLGIDDGEGFVGIRAVPFFKMVEGFPDDAFVALGLAPVRRLHQETQLYGTHLRLVHAFAHLKARAGGPGEIVDVVAVIGERFCAIGIVRAGDFHTARANHLISRGSELHVVDTEVREEFGGGVILMAIPGSAPPHADFRKPLAAEHEVALPSRAGLRLRHLVVEDDLELHEGACGNGLSQRKIDDGFVVFVSIIGGDEMQLRSEIALAYHFDAFDFLGAEFFGIPLVVAGIAAAVALGLAHPGGVWLKGILVKMEREVVERLAGEIVVGQDLRGIDGVRGRVIFGVDLVVNDALRHGRRRIDGNGRVGNGLGDTLCGACRADGDVGWRGSLRRGREGGLLADADDGDRSGHSNQRDKRRASLHERPH